MMTCTWKSHLLAVQHHQASLLSAHRPFLLQWGKTTKRTRLVCPSLTQVTSLTTQFCCRVIYLSVRQIVIRALRMWQPFLHFEYSNIPSPKGTATVWCVAQLRDPYQQNVHCNSYGRDNALVFVTFSLPGMSCTSLLHSPFLMKKGSTAHFLSQQGFLPQYIIPSACTHLKYCPVTDSSSSATAQYTLVWAPSQGVFKKNENILHSHVIATECRTSSV